MKDVLKDAKSDASGKEMVQKSLATAEHQVKKATKCKQDNGVDCDDVAPGAGVDQSKLDYCMELSDSDTVRTNIRKAFEVGNLRTGCALLSLATNSVLKSIHDCMCGSSGGGGGGGGGANQDNGDAVNAVAHQLVNPKVPEKTLSDVPARRLRFKETNVQLVGQ